MDNRDISNAFSELSTPLIADACLRLKLTIRIAPPNIRPLITRGRIAGLVLPVRHYGSVDIFLEAMGNAEIGDILVIDNGGRTDEGCIGNFKVTKDDIVFADDDGVLFVANQKIEELLSAAVQSIKQSENRQRQ